MSVLKSWDAESRGARSAAFPPPDGMANFRQPPMNGDCDLEDQQASSASKTHLEEIEFQNKRPGMLEVIERLEQELDNALVQLEKAREEGFAKGYKEGKADGILLGDSHSTDRFNQLEEALVDASSRLTDFFDQQTKLGLSFAGSVLENVLGDRDAMPDRVIQAALMWKEKLSASTLVSLRVAEADFPDTDEITKLTSAFAPQSVERDARLSSGSCVFDLKLGQLDASVPLQLRKAIELLDQFSSAPESS